MEARTDPAEGVEEADRTVDRAAGAAEVVDIRAEDRRVDRHRVVEVVLVRVVGII